MTWIETAALGVLQGATEFLPVSSSGHLALAEHALGANRPQTLFDLYLHIGTLLAVLLFFFRPLRDVVFGSCGWLHALARGRRPTPEQASAARMAGLVAAGSVPAGVVGFWFGHRMESLAADPDVVGGLLIVNGLILLSTLPAFTSRSRRNRATGLTWIGAVVVGLAQSTAILRGISRSGATITAARHLGLSPDDAARFSFFLFIPAVLGALIFVLSGGWPEGGVESPAQAAVGGIVAMVTGVLALRLLMRVLRAGKLYWFGPYCISVGLLTVIVS